MRVAHARLIAPSVGMLASAGLTALFAGCASVGHRSPDPPAVLDTILFVSARARVDGRDSRALASRLEYGMAVLRRRADAPDEVGTGHQIVDSVALDSLAFVRRLQAPPDAPRIPFDFAVLYVHGMGTSLHEAWQHTAAARLLAGRTVPWIVFCWPATGAGVAWPRGGDVLTTAYRRDSVMARQSQPLFVEALATIGTAVPPAQLLIASHSLGGQLVGEALRGDSAVRAALTRAPLRALTFILPDVAAARFRDSIAPAMAPLAERRVLYASRRDRVLTMAGITGNTNRAGLRSGDGELPPDSSIMETVDITNAVTTEGWFQQRFGTHHALKRQRGLLFDLVHVVGTRRDAACRERTGMATRTDAGVYALQHVLPDADAVLACPTVVGRPP